MYYTILLVFLILFLLFTLLVLFVITSALIGFLLTRVPFVPTSKKDVEFLVSKIGISSKDYFFDLGSGDGKVVFLVERLSGARTRGFELTWWTYLLAKLKKLFKGSKAELVNRNFFRQDWSQATVIYGYLYPPLMRGVEEKFLQDCKPGTLAVIRDFPLPTLKPLEVFYRPKNHEIYVYKK